MFDSVFLTIWKCVWGFLAFRIKSVQGTILFEAASYKALHLKGDHKKVLHLLVASVHFFVIVLLMLLLC